MRRYELVVPCHFGLEAVTKREIYDLGYEISRVEDGRVTFIGDEEAICRSNIFLRTAERVLLQVGRFHATTFDELFEGINNGTQCGTRDEEQKIYPLCRYLFFAERQHEIQNQHTASAETETACKA